MVLHFAKVPGRTGLTTTSHTGWEEPVQTGHKQMESKQVSNCVLNVKRLIITSKWNHHRFSSKTNNYFDEKLQCCRFIRGNDAFI